MRRGYRVSTFERLQEVIDAVQANPAGLDALVTGFNMPGLSGIDVTRAVLARRAEYLRAPCLRLK